MVTNLPGNQDALQSTSTAVPALHAAVSGAGEPVILLHGLFGMGSNLGALARVLADDHTVHQLDLPNHGRSGWTSIMNHASLAAAVANYIHEHDCAPCAVVGHSLGGKVAMQLALQNPDLVRALVIADIAPIDYPASHDAVFAAIAAVEAARPASRADAGELMRNYLAEPGVVQFLLLSLHRDKSEGYVWRFNAAALRENYAALRAAPVGAAFDGPALFIYGTESNYVDTRGRAAASAFFTSAEFAPIEGTGHWLHAEKPKEFNARVAAFLTLTPDSVESQA